MSAAVIEIEGIEVEIAGMLSVSAAALTASWCRQRGLSAALWATMSRTRWCCA